MAWGTGFQVAVNGRLDGLSVMGELKAWPDILNSEEAIGVHGVCSLNCRNPAFGAGVPKKQIDALNNRTLPRLLLTVTQVLAKTKIPRVCIRI